jgi:DNA-directed RNA polymerase subunit M/transcription elongation factor TFIIS
MSAFAVGERVWCRIEGHPWWPAKVVEREQTQLEPQSPEEDTFVIFYGPEASAGIFRSSDPTHIVPFENSSEKNVAIEEELKAAIQECDTDPTALPLRIEGHAPRENRKRARSPRERETRAREPQSARNTTALQREDRDRMTAEKDFVSVVDSDLVELRKRIEAASAAHSVRDLREALLACATIKVSYPQLKSTRIGVAVGNLYGDSRFASLQSLVHAIVCYWAGSLPQETLQALKRIQTQMNDGDSSAPSMAQRTQTGTVQATSFVDVLREAFQNTEEYRQHLQAHPEFSLDAFCSKLNSSLTTTENRTKAKLHLTHATHTLLRKNLLDGSLTPENFAQQLFSLRLPEEQAAIDQREAEIKRAEESAGEAGNITEMFECPRCGKNETRYWEAQMRGGDEPTTKNITCLNPGCKHVWTTE